MAFDKDEIYEQAIDALEKNNIFFIEHLVAYLSCGRTTFWDMFPADSDELKRIKELLSNNRIKTKIEIHEKLKTSSRSSELLALYRLICTPEERQNLNQSYIDHTSKGSKINDFSGESTQDLVKRAEAIKIIEQNKES